jgi:hypothetical protein
MTVKYSSLMERQSVHALIFCLRFHSEVSATVLLSELDELACYEDNH